MQISAQGVLGPCISVNRTLASGTFNSQATAVAACSTSSGTFSSLYQWNNGLHSKVVGTVTIGLTPAGETAYEFHGTVVPTGHDDEFIGDTVDGVKILFTITPLACFTPQGLTSISGPTQINFTHL